MKDNTNLELSRSEREPTSRRQAISNALLLTVSALIGSTITNPSFAQAPTDDKNKDANKDDADVSKYYDVTSLVSSVNDSDVTSKIITLDSNTGVGSLQPTGLNLNTDEDNLKTRLKKLNDAVIINNEGTFIINPTPGIIDTPFIFNKLESVIKIELTNVGGWTFFSPQKVELLLNEAIQLFERGLRDRAEWDEKAIAFFRQILELQEFFKLDDNLQKQEKDGYYELDYNKTKSDLEIEKNNQKKYANALLKMTSLINNEFSSSAIDEQQSAVHRMNFAAHAWSAYFSDSKEGEPYQHTVNFNHEGPKEPWKEVVKGSLSINQFSLNVQKSIYEIQSESLELNSSVSTLKKTYLDKRLEWEQKNIAFKKERDNAVRESSIKKLASLLAPDGVLNQLKRLEPLKNRFSNDFIEAYLRIRAAEYGLKRIFGYNTSLPDEANINNPNYYDHCLDWTRSSINFINRFKQSEVNGIIPISVRAKYSNYSQFLDAYKSGEWLFTLDSDDFKDKYNVRLRAVSLSIVGLGPNYKIPDMDGCFSASIKIPVALNVSDHMKYIQMDDQVTNLPITNFPKIPEIVIGRVFSNANPRNVEVAGSDIIQNASPIGKWQINLNPLSRNFYYYRTTTGKLYWRSIFAYNSITEGQQIDEGIIPTDANLTNEMLQDYMNKVYDRYPKFVPRDFFDIQMDMHIAYKTRI